MAVPGKLPGTAFFISGGINRIPVIITADIFLFFNKIFSFAAPNR